LFSSIYPVSFVFILLSSILCFHPSIQYPLFSSIYPVSFVFIHLYSILSFIDLYSILWIIHLYNYISCHSSIFTASNYPALILWFIHISSMLQFILLSCILSFIHISSILSLFINIQHFVIHPSICPSINFVSLWIFEFIYSFGILSLSMTVFFHSSWQSSFTHSLDRLDTIIPFIHPPNHPMNIFIQ